VRSFNFNRANNAESAVNLEINQLIEAAEPPSVNYRQYLGASSIGSPCLRKIQFDWMCDARQPVLTMRFSFRLCRSDLIEVTLSQR
jgi:hypothetical protein